MLVIIHGSASLRAAESYPNSPEGAKALLSEFLKPGADLKALSKTLQPAKADYEAVFASAFAQKLAAMYEPAWASGALVIAPKPGQTEVLVRSVPSSEVRVWSAQAAAMLPGGYQQLGMSINDGFTIYAFKFVKPGESLGMAFDGLTFVNNHWCLFPKPWRAADAPPAK